MITTAGKKLVKENQSLVKWFKKSFENLKRTRTSTDNVSNSVQHPSHNYI